MDGMSQATDDLAAAYATRRLILGGQSVRQADRWVTLPTLPEINALITQLERRVASEGSGNAGPRALVSDFNNGVMRAEDCDYGRFYTD